ncbi:hypothetical protein [Sutcliffiella rhizosphaerae]|uniref:hypothetical protein n=1 Tax=Sutcliffiella rhizosphaerae TaxID=2880967 RepID=UPI001E2AA785|nr:hypothetical protein [Sutcliffiella rhizosphaerae]
MNILKKAHQVHMVDYDGKSVTYPSNIMEAAEKWLEVYRNMVKKSTEKNIKPVLRN